MSKHDYQGYLIDLDGTMYKGKDRIPAAPGFIQRLREAGKQVLFVTNNSTRTPETVAADLTNNHGITTQPAEVYTTALATADYLAQTVGDRPKTAYVIGEAGLKEAIRAKGFALVTDHPSFVVVGLDTQVTYAKLETAVLQILAGATFIGTNADSNLPNERGLTPGAGSLIKLVEYATAVGGVKPIMIGKPEVLMIELALQKLGLTKDQAVMVGDNYNTDIRAGLNAGVDTLLVYTGVSTPAQVAQQQQQPTHTVRTLDEWQVD